MRLSNGSLIEARIRAPPKEPTEPQVTGNLPTCCLFPASLHLEQLTKMNLAARLSESTFDQDADYKGAETCPLRHIELMCGRIRIQRRLQTAAAEGHFCYALLGEALGMPVLTVRLLTRSLATQSDA